MGAVIGIHNPEICGGSELLGICWQPERHNLNSCIPSARQIFTSMLFTLEGHPNIFHTILDGGAMLGIHGSNVPNTLLSN